MFSEKLKQYAELLIRMGLNVQPHQPVLISCPVDCARFGRLCEQAAYDAGASFVEMSWGDDFSTRARFLYADADTLEKAMPWTGVLQNAMAERGAAFLSISASDPGLLTGVDADRIRAWSKARGQALLPYRRAARENHVQWCVASVPVASWAKKVFPGLEEDKAMDALWELIFKTVHISDGGDAVNAWKEHIATLSRRRGMLDGYHFASLHYSSSNGTDLTITLPRGHFWGAGQEANVDTGTVFVPNMPTEEIFTAPKRDGVNGTVVSTKPLVLDGTVVDHFSMRLEQGKIVDVKAESGLETLLHAISVDEGASYLGEVALVPYDSPISNSGVLFYNTLFDENAACHLAFGAAYPMVEGAGTMSDSERLQAGLNDSMTHVDFMIGARDLSITGITPDGKEIPVFRDGNFAF